MSGETERPPAGSVGNGAADRIRAAFADGSSLDLTLPRGRLVLDGSRPFLLVVRHAPGGDGFDQLVRGEASYLVLDATGDDEARAVVRAVVEAGGRTHGGFLVMELWEGAAGFRVYGPDGPARPTVRALADGLAELDRELGGTGPGTETLAGETRQPPGRAPLLTISECHGLGVLLMGIEVPARFRDPETGAVYPLFLRRMAHGLSAVLRQAVFEFVKVQTGAELESFRALGRRTLGSPVWEADRELADIDASFDMLLLVSPVNAVAAWERFRDQGYERAPDFRYRLLPVDPDLLKRRLYAVRLEDVDDPAAWRLLRDKREELDKQITLMADRNSPGFLQGSIRLFGQIQASLLERAEEILDAIPPPAPARRSARVGAAAFAARAAAEFDHYRARYDGFESEIQIRPDVVGLMVSSGRLLIGSDLSLGPGRVEALIQHEVGTHVLTYVNGAAQPFIQLSRGFADYDELQEGLGVLAEYMVGGLDGPRMRLLAARVVAARGVMDGATFVESFRRLHRDLGFGARTAFHVATRVHEGGGFTRDMIYLRGLVGVVEHLRDGGELEPMYIGKIAARHLEVMREFRERGVLHPAPLLPQFLERPEARERLRALRDGLPLHAMISKDAEAA